MAEYLIQDETLTGIGDKIRVLSGTEDTMTPVEMQTSVDEANTEVTTQSDIIAQISAALGTKVNENLDTVLSEQDTLISQIATALEGKSAASGAEVVTGTFTLSSNSSNSITIPGLIGKENFSLLCLGSVVWDDISGQKILAIHLIGGANGQISYGYQYPESGYYSDTATVGLGATTWDSSTGTLTRTIAPYVYLAGDWSYIGW